MSLKQYVLDHTIRGACRCGKCLDAIPGDPQPGLSHIEHTIDLTFMKISSNGGNKEEFLTLVKKEFPGWLDGNEHSYIELGAQLGDQGLALMTIGLGGLLDAWAALSPDTIMPFLPKETKMQMAGSGLVVLKSKGEN